MPNPCTSQAVVSAMEQICSEQGTPEKVMSDNGSHYTLPCFKNFDYVTSSPQYPQ